MQPQKAKGKASQGAASAKGKACEQKSSLSFPEDFYTAFLAKKKKPLLKKLEKIETMKEGDLSKLNNEQMELINSKSKILDQIAHFDSIRDLYFEAMSKQENDSSSWLTPDAKLRGLIALHFSAGKISTEDPHHDLTAKIHQKIFSSSNFEESLAAAKKFAENKELNEYLNNYVKSGMTQTTPAAPQPVEQTRKASHHKEAPKEVKKVEAVVQSKFMNDEDDEEEEKHEEKPVVEVPHKETQATSKPNLMLLPEKETEGKDEWFNPGDRRGGRGGRNRGGRGPRGDFRGKNPNFNRERPPRDPQENTEEHSPEEKKPEENEAKPNQTREHFHKRRDGEGHHRGKPHRGEHRGEHHERREPRKQHDNQGQAGDAYVKKN